MYPFAHSLRKCPHNSTANRRPPSLTRLAAAVRAAGLPPSSFVTLQHGEKAVVRAGQLVNTPNTLPVAGAGAGAGATA